MSLERFKMAVTVHLFILKGDEILMLRRFNTGYEDGNYSVVAGHLDGNEQVKEAAIREAQEEAGISIRVEDVEIIGLMHRRSNDERIDFFVAVRHWSGAIVNMEPHKCDDLRWVKLDDLPENTIPYIRTAIDNYQSSQWFDSYGWNE